MRLGSRVADIGTGDGRLALFLALSGRAHSCIATERTPALLADARRRAARHPGGARVELRAGDGLEPLEPRDDLDVLVLAGMGARKMMRILDDPRFAALALKRLVLQPQSEAERLCGWLSGLGIDIVDRAEVTDRGRSYVLFAAEPRPGLL